MLDRTATRRRYVVAYPFVLFSAWVVAWLVNLTLRARFGWEQSVDTLYWIALKVIVWVLPAVLAIRLIERAPVARFLGLGHARRGLLWGCAVGAVLVVVTFFGRTLPSGGTLRAPDLSLAFLNAVLVAPLVEEITLRGFLMTRLELNGQSFWMANLLTTMVFAAMHLPGWHFQHAIPSATVLLARLAPIAGLSLLFGWSKKRSGSLFGAIVLHAINNLYSALII